MLRVGQQPAHLGTNGEVRESERNCHREHFGRGQSTSLCTPSLHRSHLPRTTQAGVSQYWSLEDSPTRNTLGLPTASWGFRAESFWFEEENSNISFSRKYSPKSLLLLKLVEVDTLLAEEFASISLSLWMFSAGGFGAAPTHPCSLNEINLLFLVLLPGRSATSIF